MSENTTENQTVAPDTSKEVQAAELTNARQDAAKYRVGRNESLKREAALTAVLKAHSIPFDVESADLSGLKIANGSVNGEYSYTPPPFKRQGAQVEPKANTDTTILTLDAVKKMSTDEINSRWEEVSKLLKQNTLGG